MFGRGFYLARRITVRAADDQQRERDRRESPADGAVIDMPIPSFERDAAIPDVPESEIVVAFARSSGPGGQNVNKTSTKANARWHIDSTRVFDERQKMLIKERLPNRINQEGFLFVSADSERSQEQNRDAAIGRIRALVAEALTPEKERVPTRPTKGSKARRMDEKTQRGEIKRQRQEGRRGGGWD
jgi:ribosome-associated protein